ncbi:nucleotidyl transferase AbiEii/AbiGii toxin family protein [Methylobacillus arboreus]|uniref:nucleotidyl transferase AbiEii/AbiGii toxin family protein n=1 Tax=Methylobacillus arboreus TaxID=755170 RepID=UPI001E6311D9|nr:nucleotidyl transferase AbiEii/AbiGii toxin family protein [Methylobacillus arboreus]MCB5190664.1 nucleotidyl transferase AbiEii/AbiGii toxin family protein [Methylobacillus arboreus]
MLNLEFVPPRTAEVFKALTRQPLMSGFNLIGGTALSLQIGHRLSEDLDFWLPAEQMSSARIDAIVENLRSDGHHIQLATPAWRITQAKINNQDLLSLSRDYSINGVKVTFFARNDAPYQYFAKPGRHQIPEISFQIMELNSIFEMKAWLISKRIRSRDLYDLMILLRDYGKTVRDIFDAGLAADASYSIEFVKDVLLGTAPIDSDDEGFNSIHLDIKMEEIYAFMHDRVNQYEIDVAREIFRSISK